MAKNSLVGEVIFNKGKQKSGAIHFFIGNHASGLVFKFQVWNALVLKVSCIASFLKDNI